MQTVYEIYHFNSKQTVLFSGNNPDELPYVMFRSWDETSPKVTAVQLYPSWHCVGYKEPVNLIQVTVNSPFELELESNGRIAWIKPLPIKELTEVSNATV